MECLICANPLNDSSFKPMVGTCGHTLCIKCGRSVPNKTCPLCQKELAFVDELPNFQMIEQIQISMKRERECCSKTLAYESMRIMNERQGTELAAMREKLNSMVADEECTAEIGRDTFMFSRLNRNRCKCSDCGSMVDKERCRLCTTCCVEQEIVHFEGETVKILDVDETDKVVFCSDCALEGIHKRHNTLLYTKMKHKHQIEKIVDDCEAVNTTDCAKELENLHAAREDFLKAMKKASSRAETGASLANYEEIIAHHEDVKRRYGFAFKNLETQVQISVRTIKNLGRELLSPQKGPPGVHLQTADKPPPFFLFRQPTKRHLF